MHHTCTPLAKDGLDGWLAVCSAFSYVSALQIFRAVSPPTPQNCTQEGFMPCNLHT